jgi:RND superfamily putative drug exporter
MGSSQRMRKLVVSKYKIIFVFWGVILLLGLRMSMMLMDEVELNVEAADGTDAAKARKVVEEEFPESKNSAHVLLIQMKDGSSVLNPIVAQFTFDFVTEAFANKHLSQYLTPESAQGYYLVNGSIIDQTDPTIKQQFVSGDNTVTIMLVNTQDNGEMDLAMELSQEIKKVIEKVSPPELEVLMTGFPTLMEDAIAGIERDMMLIDLVTIPLIIVALAILLRNRRLVIIPLIAIAITLGISFGIMVVLSQNDVLTITSIIPNIMMSLGLGIGVDYSLFLLSRFKEERENGRDVVSSIDEMLTHAGHTITVSGLTLVVAFMGLVIFPFEFLSSVGVAIAIVVLVSLAVNLTFVPALLKVLGEKVTPSNKKSEANQSKVEGLTLKRSYWRSIARFSSKNAIPILFIAAIIAIPVSYQTLNMTQTFDSVELVTEGYDSKTAMKLLYEKFPAGLLAPVTIVLKGDNTANVWSEEFFGVTQQFIGELVAMDEVDPQLVASHTYMAGHLFDYAFASQVMTHFSITLEDCQNTLLSAGHPAEYVSSFLLYHSMAPAYTSADSQSARILVYLKIDPSSEAARNWVKKVRSDVGSSIEGLDNYDIHVAGWSAETLDVTENTYELFPFMILFVVLAIFMLVGVMYRSVFAPIRLLATIFLTISWIYGLSVLFFEDHWGELIRPSISDLNGVYWAVPILTFSVLIGLGMDYDLFILGRIREEVWKGKSTTEAIADALDHTGSVVTGAAAIMAIAFGGLFLSGQIAVAEFGFILALAVILDATVVRTFLVPAIMSLAEKTNWWPSNPPSAATYSSNPPMTTSHSMPEVAAD